MLLFLGGHEPLLSPEVGVPVVLVPLDLRPLVLLLLQVRKGDLILVDRVQVVVVHSVYLLLLAVYVLLEPRLLAPLH